MADLLYETVMTTLAVVPFEVIPLRIFRTPLVPIGNPGAAAAFGAM